MNDKILSIIIKAQDQASAVMTKIGDKMEGVMDRASAASQQFATGLAVVGAGLAAAGLFAVSSAAGIESTHSAFTTMLKDGAKAGALMQELNTFAASTPFEFPELAEAAKKLMAFGIAAADIQPALRRLGDIASGLNIPIGELSELYGKARVQGRLYMEDINQLTGRGIPVIQEFAKQFKVGEDKVRGLVEEGKIGFPQLQTAIESMTNAGGMFAGGMERQSKTVNGMISTLKDNLGAFARDLVGMGADGSVVEGSIFARVQFNLARLIEFLDANKERIKQGLSESFDYLRQNGPVIAGMLAGALAPALLATAAAIGANVIALAPFIAAGGLMVLTYQNAPTLFWAVAAAATAVGAALFISALPGITAATIAMGALAIATIAATWPFVAIGVAAGGAAYLIISNWKPISGFFDAIGARIENLKARFQSLPGPVQSAFVSMAGSILHVLGPIGGVIAALGKLIDLAGRASNAVSKIDVGNPLKGKIPGFATGGYTGRGGANEVAGIVHKGEYVLPKSQVDQSTGLPISGGNTTNFNMYGTINLGSADAVSEFFDRFNAQQELGNLGVGV